MTSIASAATSRFRLLHHGHSSRAAAVMIALVAVGFGYAIASPVAVAIITLIVVAAVTTLFPQCVPAILLVGPAFLHVLTYLSAGFSTRADVLSSPLTFMPVLAALFLPPVIHAFLQNGSLIKRSVLGKGAPGRWLVTGMIILLLSLATRTIGSPSPVYGATKTLGYAAFSVFPVFLVFITLRDSRDAERVLDAILLIGGVWLLIALFIAVSSGHLDLYQSNPGELLGGTNQAAGGTGYRAGMVAIVALASAVCVPRLRAVKAVVGSLAVALLVLSGHRASVFGFLTAILVLLVALLMSRTKEYAFSWIVIAIAVVGLGGWLAWRNAPPPLTTRYDRPFESESFQGRLQVQAIAIQAWKRSPVFGNGTGSSGFFINGTDQPAFGVVAGIYPHNVTLELLAEVGIFGTGVYLLTVFGLFARAALFLRRHVDFSWAVPTLVALMCESFVQSQAGADLTIHNELWILAALLSLALVPRMKVAPSASSRANPNHNQLVAGSV